MPADALEVRMITRSELLDVVYRFYPRGVLPYARIHVPPNEPFYDDTEEYRRLVEAANRGRAEYPTGKAKWKASGSARRTHTAHDDRPSARRDG